MVEYTDNIKVRISDINYGGHLGHTELIDLLHEIRLRFLQEHYNVTEVNIEGSALVMHKLSITYLNQALWENELKVHLKFHVVGVKLIFDYDVYNLSLNNQTAVAEMAMVLIDMKKQKPIKPSVFI